ncbi:HD domain-containing protein [Tabrizicola sp. BL-A-41-H6]|uniref:HD domain-containing protein n=1 Tax=Tabrizicola sp. BL-A-41-H6 TaxID=3421107 RepID=UPI003D665DB1
MSKVELARQFAEAAHSGQTRKGAGREPYINHVVEVATLVARFGGSEAQVMATWLHDTVEDCGVLPAEIAERFGDEVAALVVEMTDDKSLPKAERKELQVRNAPHKTDAAALIKICDKLSNIRAVGAAPPLHWPVERQMAYLDWADAVVSRLPGGADPVREAFADALALSRKAVAARGA